MTATVDIEAIRDALLRERHPDDHERLRLERAGCSSDASVIRYDDPDREPMNA